MKKWRDVEKNMHLLTDSEKAGMDAIKVLTLFFTEIKSNVSLFAINHIIYIIQISCSCSVEQSCNFTYEYLCFIFSILNNKWINNVKFIFFISS